ncbi:MAG: hypothetical protein R3C68_17620 [Myxococcota bacterium]
MVSPLIFLKRSQLVGRSQGSTLTGASAGSAINTTDAAGFGSGALATTQAFAASGYSSAPCSRRGSPRVTLLPISARYSNSASIKGRARFELRYDRADDSLDDGSASGTS